MIRPHPYPLTSVRAIDLRGSALDYAVLSQSPLQVTFQVFTDRVGPFRALFTEMSLNHYGVVTFSYIEPAYNAKLLTVNLETPEYDFIIQFRDGYFHIDGPNGKATTAQAHEAIFLATYPFPKFVEVPAILLPERSD